MALVQATHDAGLATRINYDALLRPNTDPVDTVLEAELAGFAALSKGPDPDGQLPGQLDLSAIDTEPDSAESAESAESQVRA